MSNVARLCKFRRSYSSSSSSLDSLVDDAVEAKEILCANEESSGDYAVAMAGIAFVVMCGAVGAALLLCWP